MKKFVVSIIVIILIGIGITSVINLEKNKVEVNDDNEEIIKIMETVYLDYVTEINYNRKEFLGKNIEIEGMFTSNQDKTDFYIYRLSDYIHYDNDEKHVEEIKSGFRFVYDKNIKLKENDWIKLIGTVQEDEDKNIVIKASSVEIMKVRGLEKVNYLY